MGILTIDIGLTNCKVSLFDMQGSLLQQHTQRYPTMQKQSSWSEQDPADWWFAIQACVQELTRLPQEKAAAVDMIAVTAHMHGMIAVDKHGQPLTHCWTLFDRRASEEASEIGEILGDRRAYELTGARLEAYTPAAKILWLKKHERDLFDKTALFLSPKDVIRVLLGGDPVTDPIDAAGMLLYDIQNGDWAEEILDAIGLRTEQLPTVKPSSSRSGVLSARAARALGLEQGIPLLVGAGDDIEALGAGVIQPGQTLEHIGTTGTIITCLDSLILDADQLVEVYPHGLPGRFLLGGATNAAGRSLDWAKNLLNFDSNDCDFLPLEHPSVDLQPEPPVYLPFISGERGLLWESHATGSFLGLREIHSSYDLALAVYYGVAFSLKEFLVAAERLGAKPSSIHSGSPIIPMAWSQLRADVYGIPISFLETPYPTGLGVALLAYENMGVFSSLNEAVQSCCMTSKQVIPDPDQAAYFERRFHNYEASVQAWKTELAKLFLGGAIP